MTERPASAACSSADASSDDAAIDRLARAYSVRARVYDRLWAPVLASMAMPLVQRMPLIATTRVLDVGTGSGRLIPALRAAAPSAWLLGIDRALGMLRIARRRVACASMDANRLALPCESFDAALLAFVLFHCPRPLDTLREVHRVLREAGVIGLATWGASAHIPGQIIWTEELDAAGAGRVDGDPEVAQHAQTDTPDKLATLLRHAGFDVACARLDRFQFRWDVDRLLDIQSYCGPPADRLATLSPARRDACRRRVHKRVAALPAAERICRLQVASAIAHKA